MNPIILVLTIAFTHVAWPDQITYDRAYTIITRSQMISPIPEEAYAMFTPCAWPTNYYPREGLNWDPYVSTYRIAKITTESDQSRELRFDLQGRLIATDRHTWHYEDGRLDEYTFSLGKFGQSIFTATYDDSGILAGIDVQYVSTGKDDTWLSFEVSYDEAERKYTVVNENSDTTCLIGLDEECQVISIEGIYRQQFADMTREHWYGKYWRQDQTATTNSLIVEACDRDTCLEVERTEYHRTGPIKEHTKYTGQRSPPSGSGQNYELRKDRTTYAYNSDSQLLEIQVERAGYGTATYSFYYKKKNGLPKESYYQYEDGEIVKRWYGYDFYD